jgi:hypothetical protein
LLAGCKKWQRLFYWQKFYLCFSMPLIEEITKTKKAKTVATKTAKSKKVSKK